VTYLGNFYFGDPSLQQFHSHVFMYSEVVVANCTKLALSIRKHFMCGDRVMKERSALVFVRRKLETLNPKP
jgi:hypothetical protein